MKSENLKKDFFDDCSKKWKELKHCLNELVKEKIIPLLELKKGEKVLDACGGTGVLMPLLKTYGVFITEFDYSQHMIDKARELHGADAEYAVGNIEEMSFESETFDKIICHNCLPHINSKEKAFNECARVLKKGGIFVISHDMGKKQVDDFHKKCHKAVCEDMMPSNKEITLFACTAGFETVEIFDEENYFAVVCKK
ncbi:MAG: class I SAM-dependent methyltransferase [Endomicrobia bacterium]|nr:class I SAM-dependent methyltransferase [Endomicrobiia bacterium]MCL2506783.1 class I SAM-dependent methyltransferase [Endomicrobiia bacterium]